LYNQVLLFSRLLVASIALAMTLLPSSANSQGSVDARLPISLDADYSGYDGKAGVLTFKGLRLTQGSIGIEADEGKASKLDFADSTWQFSGHVIIDIDGTHIECDGADLQFVNHELKIAVIKGTPATFLLRGEADAEVTEGQAGQLTYNFKEGIVEFKDQASITQSGNRISSNYLVYNINDQLIDAQATSNGEDKVKITFTPPESDGNESTDTVETSQELVGEPAQDITTDSQDGPAADPESDKQ
jgi:lipopolysaccharide transport protein LptA